MPAPSIAPGPARPAGPGPGSVRPPEVRPPRPARAAARPVRPGALALATALPLACGDPTPPERAAPEPGRTFEWTPAVHLFDLEPVTVECGLDDVPEALLALLAEGEVEVIEERLVSQRFLRETPPFSDLGHWVYHQETRFPPVGARRLMDVDELHLPDAGQPTDVRRPRGVGEAVLDIDGLRIATDAPDQRPPTVTLTYRTASGAVEQEMISPPVGPGGLPLTSALALGHDTRRSSLVGTPSRVAWVVDVPPGATLDLALGANRFGLEAANRGIRHSNEKIGACEMRVEARPLGPDDRPRGEPRLLLEERIDRRTCGRFRDRSIDLAAMAGQRVELALVAEAIGSGGARRPIFPFWTEPVLATANPAGPPNILVILLDTLRADRLGCYGWERARTPSLDRLAREGARFADATSGAPWTLPSHASLFTSLHVSEHGLWRKDHRLPESATTLAEVLRDHGYRTAAFTEGAFVRPLYGLAQGFERFDAVKRDARATFALAVQWTGEVDRPWFCFAHTYAVHSPYDPPPARREELVRPYDGPLPESVAPPEHPWGRNQKNTLTDEDLRYVRDLYDAEIAHLDGAVGEFLGELEDRGLRRDTVVLVTSDHGDEFGDHGHFEHGFSLYQEQLHVPLIVRYPGVFEGGAVAEHPVQGIDVAPTLAGLAGAPAPPEWKGLPLRLEPPESPRPVFVPFFTRQNGEASTALRLGERKYIDYPQEHRPSDPHGPRVVFDLASDPGERTSLWSPEEAARWERAAEELWERYPPRVEAGSSTLSPELRRELEALGYVDGG